jgi:hypothetical protein
VDPLPSSGWCVDPLTSFGWCMNPLPSSGRCRADLSGGARTSFPVSVAMPSLLFFCFLFSIRDVKMETRPIHVSDLASGTSPICVSYVVTAAKSPTSQSSRRYDSPCRQPSCFGATNHRASTPGTTSGGGVHVAANEIILPCYKHSQATYDECLY